MMTQRSAVLLAAIFSVLAAVGAPAADAYPPKPPEPGAGFFQVMTPSFSVESNDSKAHAEKIAKMVWKAEQRFYSLFKLTPDLINGVSKTKYDNKGNIPGTFMKDLGYRPYVTLRVFKDQESFADEWFELTEVKDKEKRLNTGLPGAYISFHQDYDKKTWLRDIRSYVDNRSDDELERTLLHEMGHLFMRSYLLEFGLVFGGPPPADADRSKMGTPSWLSEGTAQLFEVLWSNSKSSEKERIRNEAMMYAAVKEGDAYKFKDFIQVTNAHNLAAVAGDPLKATINYAQSFCVMDYFVNVDGARFFNFLQNMRQLNFERNFKTQQKGHIQELFSFQNEAFKMAYNCDIEQVEKYWQAHLNKTMEAKLKKFPEENYWIGEYYLRRGKDKENDYKKAEGYFEVAMTQAPTKGQGYLGKGRMLIRKGENEEAEKVLLKAVTLMPQDEDSWYFYGMSQVNNGKLKEAGESFEKSLAIYPRSQRALSGRALAAFHNNEFKKAVEAYESAYLVTHDPRYLMEKGKAAFFGKDYQGAQAAFNAYLQVFAKDAQGHLWYGLAALRMKDKDFGLKKIEEASKLNPGDPMIAQALKLAQKGESLRFERETDEVAATEKPEDPKNGTVTALTGKTTEAQPASAPKKPAIKLLDDE
jgi:tetratricopeptide (TPR) repeat protein